MSHVIRIRRPTRDGLLVQGLASGKARGTILELGPIHPTKGVDVRTSPSRSSRSTALAGSLCVLLTLGAAPAFAETTSPTPAATITPATTPTPTPVATPEPTTTPESTAAPTPLPSPTATPQRPATQAEATDPGSLSLAVASVGSPQAGRFFQDIGRYGFSGHTSGVADGSRIEVYRRTTTGGWVKVATTMVTAGAYATSWPVTARGVVSFAATTGGAPGSGDEITSPTASVTVRDSAVHLNAPAKKTDSLTKPTLTGSVVPARAGVKIRLNVRVGKTDKAVGSAVTDAAGHFRVGFGYGKGHLTRYTVRSTFHAANRDRWEASGTRTVNRVAVLHAVAVDTTKADVEKTYRKGCPVGRSKLQTVSMNFYGFDKRMHRGVLIIRTDLVPEITRSFAKGLAKRYPIAKMKNPNVYGGNDPKQMKANNTSGFNCRKVVGNPYAQSPHSYGIAIDVNTVQNPYRDSNGTWWPSNGKKYRDRSPLKKGMLGKKSALTKKLRSEDFFWGGLWSPGRDYQHFEYRP